MTKCDIVEARIDTVDLSLSEDTVVDYQLKILSSSISERSIEVLISITIITIKIHSD